MLLSPLRKLAREELVSCFHINSRLSYYNSKYNCDIGPFKVDISNRRNYSSQVLLDPLGEEQSVNSQIYNHSCTRDSISPYTSILQSSSLQHRFKKWQDQRKNKLTASTFSGAIGFWRGRRVQLWLEKLGAKEPFSGNMATCWSNAKEEEALERYKLITGNTILFPRFQVYGKNNLKDDWLAASPDGIVDKYYGLNSRGVLEIKCPFFNGEMKRASPWKRIPLYCIPQAQGLMEILDKDWMDFYVWTPNGSSLFRLFRDEAYWDALKIALSDFWFNHVLPAKELCGKNVITDPLKELGSLKPAPRHELYSYLVYESKHAVDSSRLLMREINGHLQN
ncbi:EXONUCLEASE PHAGE-TYPE/RECB C-TERMINAL DOMAIN-CONTAINING PROTEIN [Salix purpurea]|uniref:EXONUCLEASE PHAGE-TYPE/RECB C-TERMINAL DOMAIN-CONTAINING PROTEIN n=1 Tax=Salix purpurea TaxID=77065 RepID=A0A9Q0Z196_SALPP|nr:EXONUCLEASE PHAGE-TYPE/RECB C-TERMINAL DOMAIN-CONTAINING PROTEIN [Salix purpurea]